MTDLATRPAAQRRHGAGTAAPPDSLRALRIGGLAALGAAGAGLSVVAALVLLAWGTDTRNTVAATTAVRAAGQAWLLAHHCPLGLPSGSIGLVPMGLLALPVALLHRAGAHVGREIRPTAAVAVLRTVLLLVAPYALIAVLVARLAGGPTGVGPLAAMLGTSAVATGAGGLGVLRGAGLVDRLSDRVPLPVRAGLRAGASGLITLITAGALLTLGALVVHAGRMVTLSQSLRPGLVGGVLLAVLGLLLFPNAAVSGAGYATGAGFAVGAGTSASILNVHLGPEPAFPLLAALPADGPPPAYAWAYLLAPLAAGVVAGAVVARRLPMVPWSRLVAAAAGTGPVVATGGAALAALAGGPVGGGRLAAVGPSPWRFAAFAGVEIALAAVVSTPLLRGRRTVTEPAELPAELPAEPTPEPAAATLTEAVPAEAPAEPEPAEDQVEEDPGDEERPRAAG